MNKIFSLLILSILLLIPIGLPQAFAHVIIPPPSQCLSSAGGFTPTATHAIGISPISGTTVSGTAQIISLDAAWVLTNVKVVLDAGSGSSSSQDLGTSNPFSIPFTFTGLTPGPHSIIVCFEGTVNGNGPNTRHTSIVSFTVGDELDPVTCGPKTMLNGQNQCVPDLIQICGQGTIPNLDSIICVATNMGTMIGGTLLEIDNYALLIAAIGVNPVITGIVGITIAGIAGQTIVFLHKRKKCKNS